VSTDMRLLLLLLLLRLFLQSLLLLLLRLLRCSVNHLAKRGTNKNRNLAAFNYKNICSLGITNYENKYLL